MFTCVPLKPGKLYTDQLFSFLFFFKLSPTTYGKQLFSLVSIASSIR